MEKKTYNQLDKRTAEEIRKKIRELSVSYTPEWSFSTENPDAGSVIAMIFANQMQDNIKKFNLVLEKYRTELVNLFGISLLPAQPASAVVVMEAAVDGIAVPKGTKLIAEAEGEKEQLIFETMQEVYVSNAKLCDFLEISEKNGKFIQHFGRKIPMPVLENGLEEEKNEEEQSQSLPYPISLFGCTKPGPFTNALVFYHSFFFDTKEEEFSVCFQGSQPSDYYAEQFTNPQEFGFYYLAAGGFMPFEQVGKKNEKIVLKKEQECKKLEDRGKQYSVLILEKKKPARKGLAVNDIFLYSSGGSAPADFISDGDREFDLEQTAIFGEELAVYQECYLGQDRIFSKQGAFVTLTFVLSFGIREFTAVSQLEEDLRVMKRRPQGVRFAVPDCWAQKVSVEYYNGMGYKRLACSKELEGLFSSEENSGICKIRFPVPDDWQPDEAGAYEGRCLRIRLLQADFCYMRPGRHHFPVLNHVRFSYDYQGSHVRPERIVQVQGTKKEDVTADLSEGKMVTVFPEFPYSGESILLGFDKKFAGAPASLFFVLQNSSALKGVLTSYEYSTVQGFQPLQVIDHTRHFSSSGTLKFIPPSDMAPYPVEGRSRYWIKIRKKEESWKEPQKFFPVLEQIYCNAVEAENRETREMEEYFIDAPMPNMSFPLHVGNILCAEVWVEEKEQLSTEQMKQMLSDCPEKVRAEYNLSGETEAFYVLWEETESFQSSKPTDRHYRIDRMNQRLLFGDGVTVKIPQAVKNAAFQVILTCCDGELGNVKADTIRSSLTNQMFLSSIRNPFSGYGGENLETPEKALIRGSNYLSAGKRVVSEMDFLREVKAFSDQAAQVRCVLNRLKTGEEAEGSVSIVILMKDYQKGSYSFWDLQGRLKQHLLKHCEVTYSDENVQITEPLFVKISIQVWAVFHDRDQVMETKSKILAAITRFLDPLSGGQTNGWEIGRLPRENQIRMLLGSIRSGAFIKHYTVTANYTDQAGTHETDLKSLEGNPFVLCVNGTHEVHIAG